MRFLVLAVCSSLALYSCNGGGGSSDGDGGNPFAEFDTSSLSALTPNQKDRVKKLNEETSKSNQLVFENQLVKSKKSGQISHPVSLNEQISEANCSVKIEGSDIEDANGNINYSMKISGANCPVSGSEIMKHTRNGDQDNYTTTIENSGNFTISDTGDVDVTQLSYSASGTIQQTTDINRDTGNGTYSGSGQAKGKGEALSKSEGRLTMVSVTTSSVKGKAENGAFFFSTNIESKQMIQFRDFTFVAEASLKQPEGTPPPDKVETYKINGQVVSKEEFEEISSLRLEDDNDSSPTVTEPSEEVELDTSPLPNDEITSATLLACNVTGLVDNRYFAKSICPTSQATGLSLDTRVFDHQLVVSVNPNSTRASGSLGSSNFDIQLAESPYGDWMGSTVIGLDQIFVNCTTQAATAEMYCRD